MKRGPKPSVKAMTAAQRQARYRAAHADGTPRARQLNSVTLRCYMFFMRWRSKMRQDQSAWTAASTRPDRRTSRSAAAARPRREPEYRSFRSSAVRPGNTFSSISFSRKTCSYRSSPSPRSQPPMSIVSFRCSSSAHSTRERYLFVHRAGVNRERRDGARP